jgi:hypothetical protein
MTEQALFISRTANLRYWDSSYDRLYFGNEFCERLIPSSEELTAMVAFAGEKTAAFTFVTPYVTEAGLRRLEPLFRNLSETGTAEVVFNDWGVLRVLRARYQSLTPVMGRLLNKMKRGPRLMAVIDKLPESTVEYFRNSSFTVPRYQQYLGSLGVRRVELDNLLQGIDLPLPNLEVSLYTPFAYVTTTRLCLMNGCDDPAHEDLVGIYPCKKECQKYTLGMTSEIMPVMLIRKGNTIFFENPALPLDLDTAGISRLINQPEIPI